MNYKPLTNEETEKLVEQYERIHGRSAREVVQQTEFSRMLAALFDETRLKGRRFHLKVEWAERDWIPDTEKQPVHTRDDAQGKPVMEQPFKKVLTGGASFQIWEDVNYGTPQRKAPNELWKVYEKKLPRDAEPEEVEAMMVEAFKDTAKWSLKGE